MLPVTLGPAQCVGDMEESRLRATFSKEQSCVGECTTTRCWPGEVPMSVPPDTCWHGTGRPGNSPGTAGELTAATLGEENVPGGEDIGPRRFGDTSQGEGTSGEEQHVSRGESAGPVAATVPAGCRGVNTLGAVAMGRGRMVPRVGNCRIGD